MFDIDGQILLRSFPHPAMIIGKDRKVLACNEAAAEAGAKVGAYCWHGFGQSANLSDSHYKLSIENLDHPEIKCTFCRADDCLSDNAEVNDPLLTSAVGIFDTYWVPISENAYLHYAIDITEKKKAEEIQQTSLNRFKSVLDHVNALIYVADLETYELLFVNKYGRDIWGDIEGELCWKALQVNQSSPCSFCTNKQLLDDKGQPSGIYRWEFQNTANKQWYDCQDQLIQWDDGRLVRMEIATNITERKKAEEALRENDRIKTEFINTVAHELSTPLTSIQGFSELLLSHDQLSSEQQKEFLGYIHDKSIALAELVDDMLDIARIEAGKGLSLELAPCTVREIFRQVEPFFKFQDTQRRIDVSLLDESTLLNVDKSKIGQVLENLISNAVKFSSEDSLVQVGGGLVKENYQFFVTDKGIGMPPEQVEKVFDKFYRADSSNTAVAGVGLGMNIVKHIIEEHDGRIWIESELGKGTTVRFAIPRDG